MSHERSTPFGTPVVIAPGRIPLLGEHVGGDGLAVVAAITRYAKAQFITRPGQVSTSLVSQVVERTGARLGEVSAALPTGSVVVDDQDFSHRGQSLELGCTAATAVASVGALLETLGLPIDAQRELILSVADAGRSGGEAGSGAGSLAATHGGLVQIVRASGAPPSTLALPVPKSLCLVVFAAGPPTPFHEVVAGVRRYAAADAASFGDREGVLRHLGQRFVDEVAAGRATGAVWAAAKYADELADLCLAAQIPFLSGPFAIATQIARELGGMAKPTGVGGGGIGIALFATCEAAELFRKAVPPTVTILAGDFDRLGVRCGGLFAEYESAATVAATASPESAAGMAAGEGSESLPGEPAPAPLVWADERVEEVVVDGGPRSRTAAEGNLTVRVGVLYRARRWLALAAAATVLALGVTGWLASHRTRTRASFVKRTLAGSFLSPAGDLGRAEPARDHATSLTRTAGPARGSSLSPGWGIGVAALPAPPVGRPEGETMTERSAALPAAPDMPQPVPPEPTPGDRDLAPAIAIGAQPAPARPATTGGALVRALAGKGRRRDLVRSSRAAPEVPRPRPAAAPDPTPRAGNLSSEDF
jgi:mevalonate kinase